MTLDTQLVTQLQKLFERDPSLPLELSNCHNLETAAQCIAAAANRHDVALDSSTLFEQLQAAQQSLAHGELTDEQLAGVDGGMSAPDLLVFYEPLTKYFVQLPDRINDAKKSLSILKPITITLPPVTLK